MTKIISNIFVSHFGENIKEMNTCRLQYTVTNKEDERMKAVIEKAMYEDDTMRKLGQEMWNRLAELIQKDES